MAADLTITSDSSRLKEALSKLGMSTKAFAEQIGVDPSTLSKKIKGDKRLTPKDYKAIASRSSVSTMWLRTGVEPAFVNNVKQITGVYKSSETRGTGIPFYNHDFECGIESFTDSVSSSPAEYISVPGLDGATLCCLASGHSMDPVICNNDILVLKKVDVRSDYLQYGEIYAIDTIYDVRTVKRVRKGSDPKHLLLVSVNEDYEPCEIEKESIRTLFQVIAVIRKL